MGGNEGVLAKLAGFGERCNRSAQRRQRLETGYCQNLDQPLAEEESTRLPLRGEDVPVLTIRDRRGMYPGGEQVVSEKAVRRSAEADVRAVSKGRTAYRGRNQGTQTNSR